MKVCVQRALLVVVIHLALAKHDVTHAEVEDTRLLVRVFRCRQIRVPVRAHEHARDRMIDDDIFQIPLLLQQRDDLNADAEMIHFQQRRRLIWRRAVDYNVIHIHSRTQTREMNGEIAHLQLNPDCFA